MGRIFAAADIGSNTCHLLVAEWDEGSLRRIRNESEWLSLGEAVQREKRISPELAHRLTETLRRFRDDAEESKAQNLYVFATEAMRMATNHQEVLSAIARQTGVYVDLISPQREAELSLRGAMLDSYLAGPLVLVEVGGGSMQVAHWDGVRIGNETSLPLGTGRLIAQTGLTNPSRLDQIEKLEALVDEHLVRLPKIPGGLPVIASGGIARGLIRAAHPDGDRCLHLNEVEYIRWAASRLPLEAIQRRFAVKTKRAATLLPGSIVLAKFLIHMQTQEMIVSDFGIREGAILELAMTGVKS
jgi:exopolyphosphatase/guanosine-5'-triphosphate,3'-diphosphate pyrophosphatase